MSSLSDKAELAPDVKSFFSGIGDTLKTGMAKLSEQAGTTTAGFSTLATILSIILLVLLLIWYMRKRRLFETPHNVARMTRADSKAMEHYEQSKDKRISLIAYLQQLKNQGVPENHFAVTNFYVSTTNAAGIFLPALDSVVSPLAAKYQMAAGARAFIIDIWRDITPGNKFAPSVQVIEAGSNWRRISMNMLPLSTILKTIVEEGITNNRRPGQNDPLFIYLRFRNPHKLTLDGAAKALQKTIEPYRLEPSFNNCRGQNRLFALPIFSLCDKIVVMSNTRAVNSVLSDYINVGPLDGIKMEWTTKDANGISESMKPEQIRKIRQNFTWIAPASEEPSATANDYTLTNAQSLGIQFIGMNFANKNDNLKAYLDPKMFGKSSFAIKPVSLRYFIEVLPPPKYPQDPKWGSGTTAGSPTEPPAIKMPT
jgi:hypothetical protein